MIDAAFPRCRAGATVEQACGGLADDLLGAGMDLPSVYLLTGDRLRCHAARGYFQVVDGFRPGTGVIGKVVERGRSELVEDVRERPDFIHAIPGLRAEVCAPVRLGARSSAPSASSRAPGSTRARSRSSRRPRRCSASSSSASEACPGPR